MTELHLTKDGKTAIGVIDDHGNIEVQDVVLIELALAGGWSVHRVATPYAVRLDKNDDFVMSDGNVVDRKAFEPYSETPRPVLHTCESASPAGEP